MALPAIIGAFFFVARIYLICKIIILILSAALVALQFITGFDLTMSFATQVRGPTTALLKQMYDGMMSLMPYTLDELFAMLDQELTGTEGIFTPTLTFTGFANMIAFKETFNTVVLCFLNGLSFILSVRFFRWALSKFGLRFL